MDQFDAVVKVDFAVDRVRRGVRQSMELFYLVEWARRWANNQQSTGIKATSSSLNNFIVWVSCVERSCDSEWYSVLKGFVVDCLNYKFERGLAWRRGQSSEVTVRSDCRGIYILNSFSLREAKLGLYEACVDWHYD